MKEFAFRKKAFKHPKWESENYRARFLSKLITITKQWAVASVGSSINQSTFDFQNNFLNWTAGTTLTLFVRAIVQCTQETLSAMITNLIVQSLTFSTGEIKALVYL
jgi:hypothetical protein